MVVITMNTCAHSIDASCSCEKDLGEQNSIVSNPLSAYAQWMVTNVRSAQTRRVYRSNVKLFLNYLANRGLSPNCLCGLTSDRENIIALYRASLSPFLRPRSINTVLVSLSNFMLFLGFSRVSLRREYIPSSARVLSATEQERFAYALNCHSKTKEKALLMLIFYSGLKVGECSSLDIGDIVLTRTSGNLLLRRNGTTSLELAGEVVEAIREWLRDRHELFPDTDQRALFLNRYGRRLSTSGIDRLIRKIGISAHLEVSSELLRRTHVARGKANTVIAELSSRH